MSEVQTLDIAPNIRTVMAPGFRISNATVSVWLADEDDFVQWCADQGLEQRKVFTNAKEAYFVLTEMSDAQVLMLKLTWGGA